MRTKKVHLLLVILALVISAGASISTVSAATTFMAAPGRLIFGVIRNTTSPAQKLFVTNTGASSITVTASLTGAQPGEFVVSPGSLTLNGGQTGEFNVQFKPGNLPGIRTATLRLSNGGDTEDIVLRGLSANGDGGDNEPSFQRVLDVFEFAVASGTDNPDTTAMHSITTTNGTPWGTAGFAPLMGDEIPMQVMEKAGPGVVSFEVLAAYAVNGTPVLRTGWYEAGNPNTRTEVFNVLNGSHQMIRPAISGGTTFDPGTRRFGLYTTFVPSPWNNRHVYSEDAFNTFETIPARRHKVRFYPLKNANGVIEPHAYIATWEEFTNSYDYNDIIVIVRNVKPAGAGEAGAGPVIRFHNLNWIGYTGLNIPNTDWMHTHLTMDRTKKIKTGTGPHMFNDTAHLRIFNDGAQPLQINALTISNPAYFTLPRGETSLTIPPASFYDLAVKFIENTEDEQQRTRKENLTLATNAGTHVIRLAGGYQLWTEGYELRAHNIVGAFHFATNVGFPNTGEWVAYGEEVLSKFWRVAEEDKPVYVRQLAAYHGCCTEGSRARITLDFTAGAKPTMRHANMFGQALQPHAGNVVRGGYTEMYVVRTGTDPNQYRFEMVVDGKRACAAACGNNHGLRWYPARSPNGWLIPNTWIVLQDYVGIPGVTNFDFQDNVYLISNVRPDTLTGAPDVVLSGEPLPAQGRLNGEVTLRYRLRNARIFAPSSVTLNINLPASFQLLSAPAGCTGTTTVSCVVSNFQGGDLRFVDIRVRTTQLGNFTVTANAAVPGDAVTNNNNSSFTVNVANQSAPVANNDSYATDQGVTLNVNSVQGVLANDTDANGDPLTAILVSTTSNGTLMLNATGAFTYTPNPGFHGEDTFTYKANDGTDDSNVATVTIRVRRFNQAPVANNDNYVVNEDTLLTVNAAQGVLANDTDPNGDPLTAVLVTAPTHSISFTLNPNGSFTYLPAADYFGTDFFTYKANDGDADSNIATVTITILPVPDVPVAFDDVYQTEMNTTLNVNAANGVLANDYHGDGLPMTAQLVSGTSNGSLTLRPNGSIVYTPNFDFSGTDTFVYRASDGQNLSEPATVTINIGAGNRAPVAVRDSYTALRNTPLVVLAAEGVLANDSHPDGRPLTAQIISLPTGINLVMTPDGGFTYTPATNYEGRFTFSYAARDDQGSSAIASVTITVVAPPEEPYELIYNGSFETKGINNRMPGGWTVNGMVNDRVRCGLRPNGKKFAFAGECAFLFRGNPNKWTVIAQRPDISLVQPGDVLRLSFFAKAVSLPNRSVSMIRVRVFYQDSTIPPTDVKVRVPAGTYNYTAFVQEIPLEHEVAQVRLNIRFSGPQGTNLWLDNVSLRIIRDGTLYAPPSPGRMMPGDLPLPPAPGAGTETGEGGWLPLPPAPVN